MLPSCPRTSARRSRDGKPEQCGRAFVVHRGQQVPSEVAAPVVHVVGEGNVERARDGRERGPSFHRIHRPGGEALAVAVQDAASVSRPAEVPHVAGARDRLAGDLFARRGIEQPQDPVLRGDRDPAVVRAPLRGGDRRGALVVLCAAEPLAEAHGPELSCVLRPVDADPSARPDQEGRAVRRVGRTREEVAVLDRCCASPLSASQSIAFPSSAAVSTCLPSGR